MARRGPRRRCRVPRSHWEGVELGRSWLRLPSDTTTSMTVRQNRAVTESQLQMTEPRTMPYASVDEKSAACF
jgi:hypothetical protein